MNKEINLLIKIYLYIDLNNNKSMYRCILGKRNCILSCKFIVATIKEIFWKTNKKYFKLIK